MQQQRFSIFTAQPGSFVQTSHGQEEAIIAWRYDEIEECILPITLSGLHRTFRGVTIPGEDLKESRG